MPTKQQSNDVDKTEAIFLEPCHPLRFKTPLEILGKEKKNYTKTDKEKKKKKLQLFFFKKTTMLRNVARIARPLAVRSLAPAVRI